ncbi:MAG: DUF3597 domain-containing protein, partial [Arenimonas sp.]
LKGIPMGIFANILGKLGIGHGTAHPVPDIRPLGPKPVPGSGGGGSTGSAPMGAPPAATAPTPTPAAISEVDVVAQLEKRATANSQKLNWRTSIVDLLKLLDIDSSLAERKALATELGAPASLMDDSASMNIWLHKEVLKRIAANGGNVPANLLD